MIEEKVGYLANRLTFQEEEIERLQSLKTEFINNINHEARTPLVGITSLGTALLASYDDLQESQRRGFIQQIAENSDRLESLVESIIDLSKLRSLSFCLRIKEVNLSELIHHRIESYKKLFLYDSDQQFIVNVAENIIVKCDVYYIKQSIDNLIRNAVQYGQGKSIKVRLKKTKAGIEFTIADRGIGIPLDEVGEIFGAFVVSSKTKSQAKGRGVGLALCKAAIEAHGGMIEAISKGKGAKFRFVLPL